MNYKGKAQLTIVIDSPAELEAEGDRILDMHEAWIRRTHYREGDKALLQYDIAKSRSENGNVIFVMTEVYETTAGIDDHIAQAQDDEHHDLLLKWWERCNVTFVRDGEIIHSLW